MNRIWDFNGFGDKEAFRDDTGVSVSYRELDRLQRQLSDAAASGELTMMLCENSIGALSGYAALLNSGHPVLPVSAELDRDMRRQIMNTYRPGLIFVPGSLQGEYRRMRQLLTIDNYVLLKTSFADPYPVHPSLAQMITTSGSTGSVKFVRQSWDNISCNARLLADAWQLTGSDRTITALPMQYTYGLSVIAANLTAGAAMIVTRSGILDEEFWDLFINEQVTAFHGVPGTYGMLQRLGVFSEDYPDLRLMTQAGGKLSADLHRAFAEYPRDYGKRFVIMYGQSEATAAISYLPPEKALEKIGSVGTAFPGGTVRLTDAEGNALSGAHVSGELVYRGGNVALGYASCGADLARGDDWHGELHTGDIGEWDEDGFLYITGRLGRFIKIAGYRISLDEIDDGIMNDLHIQCVSAGDDDKPVIFVLDEEYLEPVRDYVRQKFRAFYSSFRFAGIDSFPVNDGGKILYGELLKMARETAGEQGDQ